MAQHSTSLIISLLVALLLAASVDATSHHKQEHHRKMVSTPRQIRRLEGGRKVRALIAVMVSPSLFL